MHHIALFSFRIYSVVIEKFLSLLCTNFKINIPGGFMFENQKYITRGIQEEIPIWIQSFMWQAIDRMDVPVKDYLQIFSLECTSGSGKPDQHIIHSQEQPQYRKDYQISGNLHSIDAKIYVIDDVTHSTMLLAEEY